MKRNFINTILTAGLLIFGLASCKKNLVLSPNNAVTSQQVFSNLAGYTQAMAKVYGSFALTGNEGPNGNADIQGVDEGTSDFFREFWNCEELTTDEAVFPYNDPGVQDLHNMVWSETNAVSQGLYYRSLFQITLCNNFLQQATPAMLTSRNITGSDAATIANYAAECRFLRAYQYWVLMDIFGNPPFVTDATPIGSAIPKQISRADLYAYVVSELKAIDPLMAKPNANLYGRADEAAVWALLARVYLNAGVYTGTPDYGDALTYAQKVISTTGYGLIPNYTQLMLADDNLNSIPGGGTVSEFIFTINYDGTKTQGYGGTQYLVFGSVGGSMPTQKFGISGGYSEMRPTSNVIDRFPAPATKDTSNFPNNKNPDTRAEFWYPGQTEAISNVTVFTNGLGCNKFRDVSRTGVAGTSLSFASIDMPVFRLPEMYLIYAEAFLRGGTTGDAVTALGYVNKIRERAYAANPAAGDIGTSQLTLPFILDERGRELYWEGFRRTDLIRYGEFTSASYLWPFKGGVAGGTGVADYRNLFPLPESDLAANPNLKQNTGY